MHQAQIFIDTKVRSLAPSVKLSAITLNPTQATALKLALANDAANYFYSGAVSIGDGIQAIERSLYSWATVKLYYAVFYIARSLLAIHGTAVLYDGTKPFSLESIPGATAIKREGPTHKAVLSSFASVLPNNPLISQPIGSISAFDWLMLCREEVNYTQARFCEPKAPAHFKLVAQQGIRKSVSAYVRDDSYLYTFDSQHAMLALPVEALKQTLKIFSAKGAIIKIDSDDAKYLSSLYFDKAGPLSEIISLFRSI